MASFFRGGSIRDNLAHLLAMSYGMSGAVEVADDLLAQTGISDEISRLRAENQRLRKALEDARRFVDSSDCSCVIDTMNIAEHTPDCPVQAMAERLDDALEVTDD